LPVEATADDMVRLGLISPDDAGGSLKKIARRLTSEGIVHSFRATTGLFTLAQTPAGDCIYLHPVQRQCTVYEKRPSVCRRFPEIGPRPGFCPMREKAAPSAPQRLRSNLR
jgi:Fe-S-cluster containining protein